MLARHLELKGTSAKLRGKKTISAATTDHLLYSQLQLRQICHVHKWADYSFARANPRSDNFALKACDVS